MTDVLRVIIRANADGSLCDLDQLLDRTACHSSKESMQFTIRALITRGLISKQDCQRRRGAARRTYSATDIGYQMLGGGPDLNYEELDKLFDNL
jgi:hypothetical protein